MNTYQIDAPHFCAGLVIHNNVVSRAAPIIKYMVGWHRVKVKMYCHQKGWTLNEVKEHQMQQTIVVDMNLYNDLLDKSARYEALKTAGVDNWEGYSEAMKSLYAEPGEAPPMPLDIKTGTDLRPDAAVDTGAPKA